MSEDEDSSAVPAEVNAATVEPAGPPSDLLASTEPPPLSLVSAETLVQGLRYLQQRIPEFTQLSLKERRSMARAAYLDRDVVDAGLRAAGVLDVKFTGRTAEELQLEAEEIRRWDAVEHEAAVFLKGIAAANLKRKHHLGQAVLRIYSMLEGLLEGSQPETRLRPYYDDMKRLVLKSGAKRRKKEKPE